MYDTIKSLRRSPFGEWNIVYFDPTQTDSDKILTRLRAQGCPRATLIGSDKATAGRKSQSGQSRVLNPIATPGDAFQVLCTVDPTNLELPSGWRMVSKAAVKESSAAGKSAKKPTSRATSDKKRSPSNSSSVAILTLQSPKAAKTGKHIIAFGEESQAHTSEC